MPEAGPGPARSPPHSAPRRRSRARALRSPSAALTAGVAFRAATSRLGGAVPCQQIGREEGLPRRSVPRERSKHRRYGAGHTRVSRQLGRARILAAGKDHGAELASPPIPSRRHSLRGRSRSASGRRRDRRPAPGAGCRRRRAAGCTRAIVSASAAATGLPPCSPRSARLPPLQPDLAERRLADLGANPGDFDGEGMEREEVRPRLGRREEVGQVAVRIAGADDFDGSGGGRRSRRRYGPPLRLSPLRAAPPRRRDPRREAR